MHTIIFATNNENKVHEIQVITGNSLRILSLKQAGIDIDIPEPFNTLHENASTKSRTIHNLTGENCFSEDTGLEVEELNGEPGVKSARYAGESKDFSHNIDKLLVNLNGKINRKAHFRTVISLIHEEKEHLFEGICNGHITTSPRGTNGFGYDSVFVPEGSIKTFAEMGMAEKNIYSHRKKAMVQLIAYLSLAGK